MNAPFHLRKSDLLARMEPDELRWTKIELDCPTNATLGARIGVHTSTVGSWSRGTTGVPRHVAMLLRLLVAEVAAARAVSFMLRRAA